MRIAATDNVNTSIRTVEKYRRGGSGVRLVSSLNPIYISAINKYSTCSLDLPAVAAASNDETLIVSFCCGRNTAVAEEVAKLT